LFNGGAVEDRTPVRNHATPNVYMFSKVVCCLIWTNAKYICMRVILRILFIQSP